MKKWEDFLRKFKKWVRFWLELSKPVIFLCFLYISLLKPYVEGRSLGVGWEGGGGLVKWERVKISQTFDGRIIGSSLTGDRGSPSPTGQTLLIPPGKVFPVDSPHQRFILPNPPNNNFHVIIQKKPSFSVLLLCHFCIGN